MTIHKSAFHKSALSTRFGGPLKIAVAGAGGNGSHMVEKMARLDHAMRKLDKGSLHVTLFDPDRVSETNVGRQRFIPPEVGQFKSVALVQRMNLQWGLRWESVPDRYEGQVVESDLGHGTYTGFDLLVTCVDSGAARREIWQNNREARGLAPRYWLDLGNDKDTGQVWIGEFPDCIGPSGKPRLKTVIEKYPEQYDGSVPETDTPSCSHAEALAKQRLFVNDHVTDWGMLLLENLLLHGQIECQGYWVSLTDGMALPQDFVTVTKKESEKTERLFPKSEECDRIRSSAAMAA